jgi:hypothetical protein
MSTVDGGHCHSHCRHPCRHCPADSVRVAGRRAHVIALRCSVVPGEAEQRIAPLEVAPVDARSVAPAAAAQSVAPVAVAQSAASLAAATPSRAGAGLDAANRSDLRFAARTRATDCQIEQAELGVSDRPSASRLRPAVALMVAALRAQSVAQVPAVSMGARNAGAPNYCGSLADSDLSSSDPMVEASRSRDSARRSTGDRHSAVMAQMAAAAFGLPASAADGRRLSADRRRVVQIAAAVHSVVLVRWFAVDGPPLAVIA